MLQVGNGFYTHNEELTHFALWAFARAPLIIGADLDKISNESLAILKNKELISINQNGFGNQALCVEGCELSPNNKFHIYQVLVQSDITVKMAVIIVNWDDSETLNVDYDPIKHSVAFQTTDSCTYEDVYGNSTKSFQTDANPYTFKDIEPHFHEAFYIKCLPW